MNTRSSKGITLIALIITIVVLLILAVVAIGQAQETNIVGYAQNAAGKYEEAKTNEISLLSEYEGKMENIIKEIDNSDYPAYRMRMNLGDINAEFTIILISENEAIMYYYATNEEGQVVEQAAKGKIVPYEQAISEYEVDNQYGKSYSYGLAGSDNPLDAVYCEEDDVWITAGMVNGKVSIVSAEGAYRRVELSTAEINSIIQKAN